jgi:hypothetical protein
MKKLLFSAPLLLLAVASCSDQTVPALSPGEAVVTEASEKSQRAQLVAVFNTQLRGANERPTPTTSQAIGSTQIKVYSDGRIEWMVKVNNRANEAFFMGHIHKITNFENRTGGVALWLFPPTSTDPRPDLTDRQLDIRGYASNPALAADILANPELFYVNLHTLAYPGGAIMGDLQR